MDLSAITGATGKDLEFMADRAKEMGLAVGLMGKEVLEAFKLVASAKPDLLENSRLLAEVTKQVLILSKAAGVDLADAANTVGTSLNQFGAGANQAARFINVLAAGAKFGASEVEQTSQAIVKMGAVAKKMGVDFETANAAIQLLAAGGIKAEVAGTGLKTCIDKDGY